MPRFPAWKARHLEGCGALHAPLWLQTCKYLLKLMSFCGSVLESLVFPLRSLRFYALKRRERRENHESAVDEGE
jgi:hypothetical protein